MNMEAFILGCGGMQPLPYRHLTSVLLRREGDLFLFDGGEGTQVSLKRLNLKDFGKFESSVIDVYSELHQTKQPSL